MGIVVSSNTNFKSSIVACQNKMVIAKRLLGESAQSTKTFIENLMKNDTGNTSAKCIPIKYFPFLKSCPDGSVWSHHYFGETKQNEICFDSVEGYCKLEASGCPKLHCINHFHWQVKEEGSKWVNLKLEQVMVLERAYCDPQNDNLEFPSLDPTSLDSSCKGILSRMIGKMKWHVNFDTMELNFHDNNGMAPLKIRRISTEKISDEQEKNIPTPCLHFWYFLSDKDKWVEYGMESGLCNSSTTNTISDYIEKHYQDDRTTPMSFLNGKFLYSLDLVNMIQTNSTTNVQRKMKRRPRRHLNNEMITATENNLPFQWETMADHERVKVVELNCNSAEYELIRNYYQTRTGTASVLKIERVQNPYLWRAFQNRVREITLINGKDSVNIQQLFHGTRSNVMDSICNENFDWRLHGSNVGQVYGRGTYFSPFSNISYAYCNPDIIGRKYIFVAKVIVGYITQGDASMIRPPINPVTNSLYDSSVNCLPNPTIIVKYDKQDYYPEYILTVN